MVQLPATAAIEYVAACWVSGAGGFLSGGLIHVPPTSMRIRPVYAFCGYHRSVTDKQKTDKKRQTRPPSSAGSRPPLTQFSGYVEVEAHYI